MLTEVSKVLSFLNPSNWTLKNWAILMLASGLLGAMPYLVSNPALTELKTGPSYLILVVVFCISASGFVVSCLEKVWAIGKENKAKAAADKKRLEYLLNLSVEEKQLLCGYVLAGTKTQIHSHDDGVVNGLVQAGVIYLASTEGTTSGFAYNIHNWAWDILRNTEQLITADVPTDQDGAVVPYDRSGSPMARFLRRFHRG